LYRRAPPVWLPGAALAKIATRESMAHLSTHVLDTARGIPAKGVKIELYRIEHDARRRVATGVTNADGRIAAPLISGELLEIGVYELVFHAGDYLRSAGLPVSEPAFLA